MLPGVCYSACNCSSNIMKMDPWRTVVTNGNTSDVTMNFEDNFEPVNSLPDSVEYLASLERKLAALKQQKSKKDLVQSLSERHRSCMEHLLLGPAGPPEDRGPLEQEMRASALLRCVAPERQAISLGELVELLKADLLAQTVEDAQDVEQSPEKKELCLRVLTDNNTVHNTVLYRTR